MALSLNRLRLAGLAALQTQNRPFSADVSRVLSFAFAAGVESFRSTGLLRHSLQQSFLQAYWIVFESRF